MKCYSCGYALKETEYGRQDSCPQCESDTRVCRNCRSYDTSYNNHCREPSAPRVVDKEKRNFCEWFQPSPLGSGPTAPSSGPKDLRSKAEALFKKKSD
jgi:predicted RNA-binding Zn-ribbon protein involved in translation (DUF1610 family)